MAATAIAATVGYPVAVSGRPSISTSKATRANSAATAICGSSPIATGTARPTSSQRLSPRTRPVGNAISDTTSTAWCTELAAGKNEAVSQAAPTAAMSPRSALRSRRKRGGDHEGQTGGHVEDDEPRARVRCSYVGTDGKDDERHQDQSRREPRCGISDPV